MYLFLSLMFVIFCFNMIGFDWHPLSEFDPNQSDATRNAAICTIIVIVASRIKKAARLWNNRPMNLSHSHTHIHCSNSEKIINGNAAIPNR